MAGDQSSGIINNEYGNKLLNGEGLLHLVGTIKAEISNAGGGGGGATYTAGDGIDIDESNVISAENIGWEQPLFAILTSGNVSNFSIGKPRTASTIEELADILKTDKVAVADSSTLYSGLTPTAINSAMGTNYVFRKFSYTSASTRPVSENYYTANSTSNLGAVRQSTFFLLVDNEIYCADSLSVMRSVMGYNLVYLIRDKKRTNWSGGSLYTVLGLIDTALTNKQNALPAITNNGGKVLAVNSDATGYEWVVQSGGGGASLPTNPENDGTYFLTTTVSSGTATQTWTSIPNANGNNF